MAVQRQRRQQRVQRRQRVDAFVRRGGMRVDALRVDHRTLGLVHNVEGRAGLFLRVGQIGLDIASGQSQHQRFGLCGNNVEFNARIDPADARQHVLLPIQREASACRPPFSILMTG